MTRGEAIKEYQDAFRKNDGYIGAASILYKKIEKLFSYEFADEEMRIRCIAQEIDNILCGYTDGRAKDE